MNNIDCIFCDNPNDAKSIEHIVSESFGNKEYIMKKGKVCDVCNGRFSKFEKTALTNSVFIMERARFARETKKGKNAKGKIGNLIIEGDEDFRKDYITAEGLTTENFVNFDPKTKVGYLMIPAFDKSEVATSKLLLKMGLESLFTSQKCLFKKYDFSDLKNYLTSKTNNDWPFLTSDFELQKFKSIPKCTDKFRLNKIKCQLKYLELNNESLVFKFRYGSISTTINLLNRNLEWIKLFTNQDDKAILYPKHFRDKNTKSLN